MSQVTSPDVRVVAVAAMLVMGSALACAKRTQRSALPVAFVGWSRDGSKVLCMEAERGKDTPEGPQMRPRRFLVLAVAADNSLREMSSYDARTERDRAARELTQGGFDASLLDVSSHSSLPALSAGAGENVILENGSWYGELNGRRFANRPPLAFPSPDARRAFVIPDHCVIALRPIIHLDLPDGWRRVDNADVATYQQGSPGQGVLQVSMRRAFMRPFAAQRKTPADALPSLAERFKWHLGGAISSGTCAFGNWAGAPLSGPDEGTEHGHVWILGDGVDLVMVTFFSNTQLRPNEIDTISRLARSARRAIP